MAAKLTSVGSIPNVIAEMTLEEKALLCVGDSHFSTYSIDRFDIPGVRLLDGATGANLGQLYADIVYLHRNDPDRAIRKELQRVFAFEEKQDVWDQFFAQIHHFS